MVNGDDPDGGANVTHFLREGSYDPNDVNSPGLVVCRLCGNHHTVETFFVVVDSQGRPIDKDGKPLPVNDLGEPITHTPDGRRCDGWFP